MILMGMNNQSIAIGKDQPANRFRMYQKILSRQQMHHLSQCGMVSKRMERLEVEDLLIDPLERRVRITTAGMRVGHAFCGALAGQQPIRST